MGSGLNYPLTYSISLRIRDQYGIPPHLHPLPSKKISENGEETAQLVLVQTYTEIWVSLETIILSVSSQCCPKGWQADHWARCSLGKPTVSQRPVDQVIKTLLPLLLVIKYFHAFVNRFSSFNPTGHKKHNFSSVDVQGRWGVSWNFVGFALRWSCMSLSLLVSQHIAVLYHWHGPGLLQSPVDFVQCRVLKRSTDTCQRHTAVVYTLLRNMKKSCRNESSSLRCCSW